MIKDGDIYSHEKKTILATNLAHIIIINSNQSTGSQFIFIHSLKHHWIVVYLEPLKNLNSHSGFICLDNRLPQQLSGKESACNAGDTGSIPGSGRSPEGGNGNPLQYSCLGNLKDRGAWRAIVHRVAKSWTRLSD